MHQLRDHHRQASLLKSAFRSWSTLHDHTLDIAVVTLLWAASVATQQMWWLVLLSRACILQNSGQAAEDVLQQRRARGVEAGGVSRREAKGADLLPLHFVCLAEAEYEGPDGRWRFDRATKAVLQNRQGT